ncbi:MAG: hypothetical protein RL662_549 [Bacteroidota bacterium]|jgi:3-methyladenine DNA glycosylase AlkD
MHNDTIKDMRQQCRRAMNGVASTSMRKHGLHYKLNFGVSVQQIKDIASRYQPNKELAELLWLDGTRELKILATLLYPINEFDEETANRWVHQIPNQEIREQIAFNMFRAVPFTSKIALTCALDPDPEIRTSGYWLLSRALMDNNVAEETIQLAVLSTIFEDLVSEEHVSLRNAAKLLLRNVGRATKNQADEILFKIEKYMNAENLIQKEVYDSLAFEFDFFYENLND